MITVITAIAAFIFSVLMTGFCILALGAVMAAGSAVLLAGVGWTFEWGSILNKIRSTVEHGRKRVYETRRGYDFWWKKCFFILWPVWALCATYLFIQSKDEMLQDMKHWMTFGYADPGRNTRVEEPVVVTGTEIRRYRLVSYNPPKHFYVTIKDLQTNQTYESLYVSKHCNNHATNKLGDDYNIQITHKKQGQKEWIVFNDLYAVFCGG